MEGSSDVQSTKYKIGTKCFYSEQGVIAVDEIKGIVVYTEKDSTKIQYKLNGGASLNEEDVCTTDEEVRKFVKAKLDEGIIELNEEKEKVDAYTIQDLTDSEETTTENLKK